MPIYRYRCTRCQAVRDEYRRIEARNLAPRCHGRMARVITSTMVSVFNAFQTVAHDKESGNPMVIRNSKEHRAFLARNGYEEVGTDRSMAPPHPEELPGRKAKWKDSPDAPMVDIEKLKRQEFIEEDLTT